eukprot:COSAG06_NODE_13057_length_1298_cov_1.065054_3_plen_60_part_01
MGSCSVHRPPINSDKTLSRVAGGELRSRAFRQQCSMHSIGAGLFFSTIEEKVRSRLSRAS